jgi:hypothetical protein
MFENQFKVSNTAKIMGLAYNPTSDVCIARIQAYPSSDDSTDDGIVESQEQGYIKDIEIATEWVERQYTKEFIKEVKQRTSKDEKGYIRTPENVKLLFSNETLTKVKYIQKHTREIIVTEAVLKQVEEGRKKKKGNISKMVKDIEVLQHKLGQERVNPPKKIIEVKAQWLGITAKGEKKSH